MKFFWPALEAGPGTPARALRPTRPVGVGSSGGGEHGPATSSSVHVAARSLEASKGSGEDRVLTVHDLSSNYDLRDAR